MIFQLNSILHFNALYQQPNYNDVFPQNKYQCWLKLMDSYNIDILFRHCLWYSYWPSVLHISIRKTNNRTKGRYICSRMFLLLEQSLVECIFLVSLHYSLTRMITSQRDFSSPREQLSYSHVAGLSYEHHEEPHNPEHRHLAPTAVDLCHELQSGYRVSWKRRLVATSI
jgi:hypothetical protein